VIWMVSTVLRKYFGLTVIGLTGGISTGKSTCCKYFEDATAFYVIDFDEIAHDIYACGLPAWSAIRREFGDTVLNKDWTINRKKLGNVVWKDRTKLNTLMSITRWPILKEFVLQLVLNIVYCRTQILDVPLLIEQKYIEYLFCDAVILIYCAKREQIKRLMKRDTINESEALLKIEKQMDIERKREYVARYANNTVIDNSNDRQATQMQLKAFVNHYYEHTDRIHDGTCSWKQAMKPTKLSLMISTVLFIAGYLSHRIVTLI